MGLIHQYDNRVGITYVYEVTEEVDFNTNQKKKRRKLIGKICPETGEITPTGKRGRKSTGKQVKHPLPPDSQNDYEVMYKEVKAQLIQSNEVIRKLSQEIDQMRNREKQLRSWMDQGIRIME